MQVTYSVPYIELSISFSSSGFVSSVKMECIRFMLGGRSCDRGGEIPYSTPVRSLVFLSSAKVASIGMLPENMFVSSVKYTLNLVVSLMPP